MTKNRPSQTGNKHAHKQRLSAKDALLQATGELMAERDTLDISLSDISGRAQVNSALVKYYFGNKQGLYIALLERDVTKSMVQLSELVRSNVGPVQKMRVHIAGLINIYFKHRYLNKLLFMLLRECTPEQAQDISDRLVKPAADAQRTILEEGCASGEFRQVDPLMFYFTIIGACDQIFTASFALSTVFGGVPLDDELRREFIDHTCGVLLNGIKN